MFEWTVGHVATLVSATAMAVLAGWLLLLDAGSRVHRALALLLVLRAVWMAILPLSESMFDPLGRIRVYFWLAIPFAALYFAYVYLRTRGRGLKSRLPAALILLALCAVEVAYFLDHGLWSEVRGGTVWFGPLHLAHTFTEFAYVAIGLVMARDALASQGARRRSTMLVSLAFVLEPIHTVVWKLGILALDFAGTGLQLYAGAPNRFLLLGETLFAASMALLALLAVFLWRRRAAADARRHLAWWPLPAVTGLAAAMLTFDTTAPWYYPTGIQAVQVFDAVWTLALPLLVTWALVKHHLFGHDVKVRWTIRSGTVAAFFIAVFFIASEGAAAFFGEWADSPYIGIGVAALLVFAILSPLQRLADNLAARAVPTGRMKALPLDERRKIYVEQLELAWTDGSITRRERLLFDRLRDQLGIPAAEAMELESRVIG